MRNVAIAASLWLAVPSLAQEPSPEHFAADNSAIKAALARFRRDGGGEWIVQWHPATATPSAVYGTGLKLDDWRENTLDEARRHALLLLEQQADLLGVGASRFQEIIGARMGRTWSFTFDQTFKGLPVIEGRIDVRINMKGVVAMLGSRAWQIPRDFDTTPTIGDEVATAIAWAAFGEEPTGVRQPGGVRKPQLVIFGDIGAERPVPVQLAWEVPISNVAADGSGRVGRYYVDAKSGAVLQWVDDKHQCAVPGCTGSEHTAPALEAVTASSPVAALPPVPTVVTLRGWTRSGPDAWSALVDEPLPGVVLNVPGIGSRTTDANGQFTIDIAAPVTINVGALDGRHHDPISGPNAPTASVLVNPGVPTTITLSSAAASTNEAAHTTTSFWVDKTNEFCRSILGNSSQLNTISGVDVTVNIASSCNAYYTGNTINFYNQGGSCANTAFSTVIAHEWGHGIDDRYGGIANHYTEGLSEGWGDIIGMYLVDSPLLGSGFSSPGQPLRNGNNNRMWPYAATVGNPPPPHPAGEVWMGFAWRLRENLRSAFGTTMAQAISNDIVITTLVADATTRVDAVREVFIADDDDGNLLNGTPHYAQLSAAAIQKGIPYPEIVVATISHTPLSSTNERVTPRPVLATVTPLGGSINAVRLHYNAGSGNVVRTMHPQPAANSYVALLPGLTNGGVSYHIEAVHSSNVVVRLPASGEFTYSIDGGTFAGFYNENFDAGAAGWTNGQVLQQNDWQIGDPAGRTGTSQGVAWADPQFAASGTNCYGNDLGNTIGGTNWNGAYAANVENWLRSPVVNCTGRTGVRLRFKRWLTVEEGQYDQASIRVNGVQVWQNPTNGHLIDTAWQTFEIAIPAADNNPSVQIEWRLKSDGGLQLGGWNIDDVQLGETIVPMTDATLTMLPEQAAQGTTLTLAVETPGGPRPYLLAFGDTIGPTIVPGFPTLFVGGGIGVFGGATNAAGFDVFTLTAPTLPSAIASLFYTQVLTIDAAGTQFVTSNRFVNLFTQTP